MNKETMQQQILDALTKKLGDGFRISIQQVLKTNLELDGLVIWQNGENITPTVYLEPFYEELEGGVDINDITNRILQDYFTARTSTEHFNVSLLSDFDHVKGRLYVQLINRHSNKKLLQSIPHAMFLDDFAITIRCMIDTSENCNASFLIHNNHLDIWKTDSETILSYAMQNTRKVFGVELTSMNEFIRKACPELTEAGCPDSSMWIMTNNRKLAGAATVLFDDVLKDFAEKHGSFYVIFSSIHEALLLPAPDNSDIDAITRMNQEVNAAQVEADEVLGTKAYFYHKDKGFVL